MNQMGMSLAEILVGLGIISITALVTLSMQQMNLKVQKQNQVINTAQQLQTRIRHLLTDNKTWFQTMSNNTNMACLKAQTSCTGQGGVFDIYDGMSPPNIVFDSLSSATANGSGFDEKGASCLTHLAAGSPNCPFGYVITWTPQCVGTCINPPIEIRAQLYYRPGTEGVVLDPIKYSVGIPDPFIRNATAITKSFKLTQVPPPGATSGTGGGGTCPTGGATAVRPLSEQAGDDPLNLVTVSGTGVVTLTDPGTYKCSGTAMGFAVDGFKTTLLLNGSPVGSGVGFAPKWIQSTATFETVFTTTTAGSTLTFVQGCTSLPSAIPGENNLGMGMPAPPYYTGAVYATLVCTIVN